MEASSKLKTAAGVAAVFAAAAAVVFLTRTPPKAPVSAAEPAELALRAAPDTESQGPLTVQAAPQQAQGQPVAPNAPVATSARSSASSAVPDFDAPECSDFTLVSSQVRPADSVATVRHGDSDPEDIQVGSLIDSGEVIFIGAHPTSGANTVVVKSDDGKQCQIADRPMVAQRPAAPMSLSTMAWQSRRTNAVARSATPWNLRADGVVKAPFKLKIPRPAQP